MGDNLVWSAMRKSSHFATHDLNESQITINRMVLLDNDAFLSELTRMFQRAKSSGSVCLTMKRYDGRVKPRPRTGHVPEPSEYKCLIRCSLGNKKIATVVSQRDVNKFHLAYTNLLKGNIDGLKKKDHKKTTKSKATQ